MNHTTRLFPTFILIAVFILSACAPAAASTTPDAIPVAATATEPASPTIPVATSLPVQPEATVTLIPPTEVPFAPTSRGPELHATDPLTVNLASGQLQLVEFFRFT